MAQFGVITALTATFIAVFMAGIGLGSWIAGERIRSGPGWVISNPIFAYAGIELLIGISAVVVPYEFRLGHVLLLYLAGDTGLTSLAYSCFSAVWLALCLVPWCACMGATFPVAMAVLRDDSAEQRSFSHLYLANVLGAMAGAVLPLLLIEELGFHRTLRIGALLNGTIAALAVFCSSKFRHERSSGKPGHGRRQAETGSNSSTNKWFLFATGLTSMGLEVVWIRIFTPYVGTVVYAFAAILGFYLLATFVGTKLYRRNVFGEQSGDGMIWLLLGVSGLVSLIAADPMLAIPRLLRIPLGIIPVAAAAGFATPMLVDRESQGDPGLAASGYAINVLGCVLGPLVTGFLFLPRISERTAIIVFSAPWLVVGVWRIVTRERQNQSAKKPSARQLVGLVIAFLVAGGIVFRNHSFEDRFPHRRVLRDSTATVTAVGTDRTNKLLLVNGQGMSTLTLLQK